MAEGRKDVYGAKFTTPIGRFSYPHVFEKAKGMDGQEGKYELTLLIPKDDAEGFARVKSALESVAKEAFGPRFRGLENLKNNPIKDGDDIAEDGKLQGKDRESFRGHWVIRPRSGKPVAVVNADKTAATKDDIYGGCYGRANVTPASYSAAGNWGVTLYLNAVQKWKDGERFGGGGVDPDAVFEAFEDEGAAAAKALADDGWNI